jgi:hypothetical protein
VSQVREAIVGLVLVIASFITLGVIAGCAESASEATAIINPADVTIDREFVETAQTVVADSEPSEEGWAVGVISVKQAEGRWVLAVLTAEGGGTLTEASNGCETGSWRELDNLLVLLDPGDLIEWSLEGDDSRVCSHEIRLVRKAAAL